MKKTAALLLILLISAVLCACALADDVYTPKRYPEDFTDIVPVQTYSLRSSNTEYTGPTLAEALEAGSVNLAGADRLSATLPKGLEGKVIFEDGAIIINVDMDETDWATTMMYTEAYPYISIPFSLERPSDKYDTCIGFSGGLLDLKMSYMIPLMERDLDWNDDRHETGNGEFIGEIVPSQSMLLPTDPQEGYIEGHHLICWLDRENQDERYYEYYKVKIVLSDPSPRHIPFRYVTESMLSATLSAAMPDSGVSVKEVSDGSITFLVTDTTKRRELPIVLKAPDGAVKMEVIQYEETYSVANGTATFYVTRREGAENSEGQFSIAWYNSAGKMIEYGLMMYHSEPQNYAAWPYYDSRYNAPASSRMVLENNSKDIGVTFSYNETTGDLHIGYDKNAQVTGDLGSVIAHIKAPEGATYYRTNHSGGNNIMGVSTYRANEQVDFTAAQDLQAVPSDGLVEVMNYEPLRKYIAGPVEVYIQMGEGSIWPYSGGVFTIFWYKDYESAMNDRKNPMRIDYVSDTMGEMCVTNRIPVVESEEDITEPVDEVTCVGGKHYHEGWRLRIRRYPHKGSKAFHYELTMENEYGVYQPLEGSMVFYMPYPSDYFSHPEYTFSLRHYSDDYEDYQLVDVRETDFGVRFEVSSLSPFVLDWGGYVDPEGGNNSGNDNGSKEPAEHSVDFIDLHANHKATVSGVSIRDIIIHSRGNSSFTDTFIQNLSIMTTPNDIPTASHSIVLGSGTRVGTAFIELRPDPENVTDPSKLTTALITLEGGATLNALSIEEQDLIYLTDWVKFGTGCSPESIEMLEVLYDRGTEQQQTKTYDFSDMYTDLLNR